RLDLRSEQEQVRQERVVERLDPQAIARQDELAAPRVPDRQREVALDEADEVLAFLLVEVDQGLGVGPGAVAVTPLFEAAPQRRVVVDLAVESDPDGAVLVRHRLPSRGTQVDDGEAAMRQAERLIGAEIEAGVIRAAMR